MACTPQYVKVKHSSIVRLDSAIIFKSRSLFLRMSQRVISCVLLLVWVIKNVSVFCCTLFEVHWDVNDCCFKGFKRFVRDNISKWFAVLWIFSLV